MKKLNVITNEELARAIAAALAKFSKMIRSDDLIFIKYKERYFTKDIDQLLDDLLIMADYDPYKLLRRINVLEEQFENYKNNVEKLKGDGYERITTQTPGKDSSESRRQRAHKQGANRQ